MKANTSSLNEQKTQKKRILNVGNGKDMRGTDFLDFPHDLDKDKFPYPDETFDEVYLFSVYEHLQNRGFVLDEIRRVLKKGGLLYITTDNASCLNYLTKRSSHDIYRGVEPRDKHVAIHTLQDLLNGLEKASFHVLRSGYCFNDGDAFGLEGRPKEPLLRKLCAKIIGEKYVKTNIFALAQKPLE